jgi:hypothetical protein
MKFCLDAPFPKLMGLASTFASLSNLHKLSVSINSVHAPGKPPDPVLPFPPTSLPTPTESPVLKAKSVLPQLLDFDQMQTQTCLANPNTGDPSMPLLRDIKRFVRKCPRLAVLGIAHLLMLISQVHDLLQSGMGKLVGDTGL